jgi:outer membrane receptor protein involved in Fe transport
MIGGLRQLLAIACLVMVLLPVVWAEDSEKQSFDIPADNAEVALRRFAVQSGRQVIFPTALVEGIRTNPVSGEYRTLDALDRMLAGTPLRATQDGATGALAIVRNPTVVRQAGGDLPQAASTAPTTPKPKKTEMKSIRTLLASLATIFVTTSHAQTTPADTASPTVSTSVQASDQEVVKLTPFEVSATQDHGYVASNSIAGTRSNTPIKDIPLNIQVFTRDLADDLNATTQVDLEKYNASLVNGGFDDRSDNTIQQAYNAFLFRGFIQNWGLRDGIREYDPLDTQGLARIELVKGPAAPLYGLTYPGGVMNNITKDVDFTRNFAALRFTTQSFGETRGTIDANFSDKLANGVAGVRVNLANAQTEDDRSHSKGDVRFEQVNLNWRPLPETELKFLIESGYRQKPNSLGYFSTGEVNSAGTSLNNGSDIPLQVTHPNIPWTWNWSDGRNMRSLDTKLYRGTVTQSIGDNFSVTGYMQFSDRTQIDSNGWDAADNGDGGGSAAAWDMTFGTLGEPTTGWLHPNTPQEVIQMGYHYRDWCNSMHAYGAMANYKLDVGDLKNTFTFGANAWSEYFLSHKSIQPGGTTNLIDFPVAANISTATPWAPPIDYYVDFAGGYDHENNTNDYYFANWQGSAFDNRLKVNLAINHTHLKLLDWASGTATVPNDTEESKNSPMAGVVFDVTKEVSIFAVHSTSLFPTTDKNSFLVEMPPVTASSNEIGTKIELLDGKISGTISYYQIKQKGGSQNDPTAINQQLLAWENLTPAQRAGTTEPAAGDLVPGGEQESKGFEADLVFQPTTNLQVLFSYAHNDEQVTSAINASTIGESTTGHIKDQYSILTKYTFTESGLKGLSAGIGLHGAGQSLQGYVGTVARYNPSTFNLEAFAAYKFKFFGLNQRLQLNARNLTKQDDFVGWKPTGSATIVATERYRVPTPVVFSLTYGIDF